MSREETLKILAVIRVAYPGFYSKMTAQDAELTVKLWNRLFSSADYRSVGKAVEEFISTDLSGFPPSVGQIKSLMAKDITSDELSAEEAWSLVSKAAEDGYYNSYNEFNRLPPRVRRILGSPSKLKTYSLMNTKEFDTIEYRCFIKAYNADIENEKHEYILNGFECKGLEDNRGEFEPTSKEDIDMIEDRMIQNAEAYLN